MSGMYDPWGGNDIDSQAGQQLRQALKDVMHVYGDQWPDVCASILFTVGEQDTLLRISRHLLDMFDGGK